MTYRKLSPPFQLAFGAYLEWLALERELGGLRGKFSEHQLWKLAIMAEHQADQRRRRIDEKFRFTLADYRQQFGLPAEPPPLPDDIHALKFRTRAA